MSSHTAMRIVSRIASKMTDEKAAEMATATVFGMVPSAAPQVDGQYHEVIQKIAYQKTLRISSELDKQAASKMFSHLTELTKKLPKQPLR
jgi:nitrogenase subunit NifH